jgi:membrane protein DedA with SNARE-associated domain
MSMGKFLLFSTLGSLPWNLALVVAGFVVGENYEQIAATLKPYEYVIYVVVIAGVAWFAWRWWRTKRNERHLDAAGTE